MTLLFSYTVELHGDLTEVEARRLDEQLVRRGLSGVLREAVEQQLATTSFTDHTYDVTAKVLPWVALSPVSVDLATPTTPAGLMNGPKRTMCGVVESATTG